MLVLKHVGKRYQYHKVLKDISMECPLQGMIGISGPSGCGKSTLLHIIGGIDRQYTGRVEYQGRSIKRLLFYSQKHVCFLFQQFHLIPWLSLKHNIHLSRFFKAGRLRHDRGECFPQTIKALSWGQRQKLSYMRAQTSSYDLLLCDEPTGSLDPKSARELMQQLKEDAMTKLVIVVSHDEALLHEFCDEIYEMQDGEIVSHHVLSHPQVYQPVPSQRAKRYAFPCFRLALSSLRTHKVRFMEMVVGLMLSIVCILLTLSLSLSVEKYVKDYVYALMPPSGLSFQRHDHQTLTVDDINQLTLQEGIVQGHLYLDDMECLGVGFHQDRYQESQTLFIGQDTLPYKDLPLHCGTYPQANNELLLSYTTAMHLSQGHDPKELLGRTLYAWYKYKDDIKSISYKIVGMTTQSSQLETIYTYPQGTNILLQEAFDLESQELSSHLGIIYVEKDVNRTKMFKSLKQKYPQFDYLEVGKSTLKHVSTIMIKLRIILSAFSLLTMMSSLFLMGEVMFLNVYQKKKDLAIMKCFGASSWSLLKMICCEAFCVLIMAFVLGLCLYMSLLQGVQYVLNHILLISIQVAVFELELVVGVFVFSFVLVAFALAIPSLYICKVNIVNLLNRE